MQDIFHAETLKLNTPNGAVDWKPLEVESYKKQYIIIIAAQGNRRTGLQIPDLIDFCITKGIANDSVEAKTCFDLSSNYSSIIITYHGHPVEYDKKINPFIYIQWDTF